MSTDYLHRQSGLITKEERQLGIGIVGVGGIGSHTALALARMGFHNITVYDDDVVSLQNCSSQGFDMSDVGKRKVDAVRSTIMRAVRAVINVKPMQVNENTQHFKHDVVIMAVDSMTARKNIFNLIKSDGYEMCQADFVINPSMGGEYMNIDTYSLEEEADYDASVKEFDAAWFSDDEGVEETCTTKATIYTTLLIAGHIAKTVKDIAVCHDYVTNVAYDIGQNKMIHSFNNKGENLL